MNDCPRVPLDLAQKAEDLLRQSPVESWHFKSKEFLLANTNSPWVVAFSGGADSLLILLLVYAAFPEIRDQLTVAHFNHNLRGDESNKDAIFVEEIASRLQLKIKLGRAESITKTDEGTLREQRRVFYQETIKGTGATVLIQGHNLDDIAETFLWRVARGVGVEGICAPKPVQEFGQFYFVRPLLTLPRDSIRQSLNEAGIYWRDDSSNEDIIYLRNRIRKNTLSQWKKDSDRNLLKGVERTRDLLDEQDYALEQWAKETLKESLESEHLRVDVLMQYPRGLVRKVITLWLVNEMNQAQVHQYHLDEILDSITHKQDLKIIISPSFTLIKNKNFLKREKRLEESIQWGLCSLPLNYRVYLPSSYFIEAKSMKLDSELFKLITSGNVDQCQNAYIATEQVSAGLFIRTRTKGDRFSPLGAPGTKKVKDWMIDRHWTKEKKARIPMIVNNSNQIVWIPGFPPAGNYSVSSGLTRVIRLTYNKTASLC